MEVFDKNFAGSDEVNELMYLKNDIGDSKSHYNTKKPTFN